MARLKLDLHDVYNNSKAIDQALNEIFEEAIEKRIREVEIIPGKGSGQLRKKWNVFYNSRILNRFTTALRMTAKILGGCLCILSSEFPLTICDRASGQYSCRVSPVQFLSGKSFIICFYEGCKWLAINAPITPKADDMAMIMIKMKTGWIFIVFERMRGMIKSPIISSDPI